MSAMGFQQRMHAIGLAIGLVAFIGYWVAVLIVAANDDQSFTNVSWQAPMLWAVGIGGGLYAVVIVTQRLQLRRTGERAEDVRDLEIQRYAEFSSKGLLDLVVLAVLIMLALQVETFWIVHVLFVGSYLASLATTGATLAAYKEGIPS